MRKYLGLMAVAMLVIVVLALASCGGSGSRRIIASPTPGDFYLPLVGGADTGEWGLVYNETTLRFGWFNSADDIGAFDETSGGGMAIPGGCYITNGPDSLDTDADGNPDFFYVGMRQLASYAANTDVFSGGSVADPGKIGGAWYFPDELVVDPYIVLFIPISQNLANGTGVAIYRWVATNQTMADQTAGYWSFVGMGSVDNDPLSLGRKVVVFNWSGSLGMFAAVVSIHGSGSGS